MFVRCCVTSFWWSAV